QWSRSTSASFRYSSGFIGRDHPFHHIMGPIFRLPINSRQVLSDNAEADQLNAAEAEDRYGQGGEPLDLQAEQQAEQLGDFDQHQNRGISEAQDGDDDSRQTDPLQ